MIDPSIALQFRPTDLGIQTPTQVATATQNLANLRNYGQLQQAQLQMAPLQLQAAQQENQIRQIGLDDQKKLQQAFLDTYAPTTPSSAAGSSSGSAYGTQDPFRAYSAGPSSSASGSSPYVANASASGSSPYVANAMAAPSSAGSEPNAFQRLLNRARALGVSYNGLMTLQDQYLKTQQGYATLGKDQIDNQLAANTQLQSALRPIVDMYDPKHPETAVQQAQAYEDERRRLIALGGPLADAAAQNPYPGSPDALRMRVAGLNFEKESLINSQESTTAANNAKTPGDVAESQMKVRKAQLQEFAIQQFLANPQAGGKIIDSILPATLDATANNAYKQSFQSAMENGGPDAAQKIVEAAAAHAAEISKATNKNIRDAEVAKAVAIEKATTPLKIAQAVATAKALRMGDNPAVANVAPAAVTAVQNDAIKLDQEYLKVQGTAESLGHVIDLATAGNKEAGSNLPLLGVETLNALNGIKRINSAEISQYEGAGSLLDHIQGSLGKLTVGKPIPQDVLNDIRQLHQMLGQDAYTDYTRKLSSLNNRTGAQFGPVSGPPNLANQGQGYKFTAAGPNGHLIGSNDGRTWVDVQTGNKVK